MNRAEKRYGIQVLSRGTNASDVFKQETAQENAGKLQNVCPVTIEASDVLEGLVEMRGRQ